IQMLNRFNVAWRKKKCALLDFVLFHFGIVYVIHLLPKDRCIEVAMMKWVVGKDCANIYVRDFLREKQSFSRRILKSIKTDGGIGRASCRERFSIGAGGVCRPTA